MNLNMILGSIIGMLRTRTLRIRNSGNLKTGKRCVVKKHGRIRCSENAEVILGKNVMINEYAYIAATGGEITIGEKSFFNQFVIIAARESISIGKYVKFGPGVKVYDHDHNYGAEGVFEGYTTSPIIIGDNVWVGANAIILKGTTIGSNCVIGAGAVVKGNIPDNTLVVQDSKLKLIALKEKFKNNN